tara:strand:+ start:3577 stop:4035 length:459 start_codon:yes stop_codon:yes gene_type:complete
MDNLSPPIITEGDFASLRITPKWVTKKSASHPFLERWLHNLLFLPFEGEELSLFDELLARNCVGPGFSISIGGNKIPKRHACISPNKVKCLWSPRNQDINFFYGTGGRDAKNIILWSLQKKDKIHPSLEGLKPLGVDIRTFNLSVNLKKESL